jgi:hypothetical protein
MAEACFVGWARGWVVPFGVREGEQFYICAVGHDLFLVVFFGSNEKMFVEAAEFHYERVGS